MEDALPQPWSSPTGDFPLFQLDSDSVFKEPTKTVKKPVRSIDFKVSLQNSFIPSGCDDWVTDDNTTGESFVLDSVCEFPQVSSEK